MKKLLRSLFIALIPIAAVSCAQDDMTPAISQPDTPAAETQPGLLRSAAEAIQQAITDRSNMLGIPTPGSRAELDVKCIKRPAPSRSGENDTLLYVVNFPDEEGYAVIPADRRIETLAVPEAGSFSSIDEMQNPAAKEFMKAATAYATNTFIRDTTTFKPPTRPSFEILKSDTIAEYNYPAKIKTRWGQAGAIAKYATNNAPLYPHRVVGCVPLACAMALSYLEMPKGIQLTFPNSPVKATSLNWNSIKGHARWMVPSLESLDCVCGASAEAHEQLARLCRELGHLCHASYEVIDGLPATGSNITNALKALQTILPTKNFVQRNGIKSIRADVKDGILIMFGQGSDGHCWICDGWYYLKYEENAYSNDGLYDGVGRPVLTFLRTVSTVEHDYVHINWGWDGADNGYYRPHLLNTIKIIQPDNKSDGHVSSPHYYNEISYIRVPA